MADIYESRKPLTNVEISAALIDAKKRRYADAQLPIALAIGAKVSEGEMKW